MNLRENIRETLRQEAKTKLIRKLMNSLFEGFDDIYYDWAEYNCGMGVCCDPYAVGFVLPKNDYNDYLFLLVDDDNYDNNGDYPKELGDELPEACYEQPDMTNPNFNTIIFYRIFSEDIENYLGDEKNWAFDLMDIINEKFGCDAQRIIFL